MRIDFLDLCNGCAVIITYFGFFAVVVNTDESIINSIPSLANIYCNGLVTYLRMRYKELNERDLLLCSLIALGASSSCISMVFGYEHHVTFYNIRAKLRRKMAVPQQIELETFISELVSKLDAAAGKII